MWEAHARLLLAPSQVRDVELRIPAASRLVRIVVDGQLPLTRRVADDQWRLTLGDKLRRLFDYDFPGVRDVNTTPVWAAGELLEYGGDFNKYITSKALHKQEGIVFRHCLRLILLCHEFTQFCPPDADPSEWPQITVCPGFQPSSLIFLIV